MTKVLESVMTEKQSVTKGALQLDNMPSAGMIDMIDDGKDGWFVGYTPYMTTAVWVGYDIPTKLGNIANTPYPGIIWKGFMNKAHEGLTKKDFTYDERVRGIIKKQIANKSQMDDLDK